MVIIMKMILELIIVLVVLILIILFLLYKIANNKFNIVNIKINKSEKKLKKCLEQKFELFLKTINILNKQSNFNEENFHNLLNTNLNKVTLMELNDVLIEADTSISQYFSQNEKIVNTKDLLTINQEMNELNITINATKKYYNNSIRDFNQLIKIRFTKIVAKLKGYHEMEKLKESESVKLKILSEHKK